MIPSEMYHTYQIGYRPFHSNEYNNDMNFDNFTQTISNGFNRMYMNTMRFYNQTETYFQDTFQEINESQNISMFLTVIYGIMAYLVLNNIWLRCSTYDSDDDNELDDMEILSNEDNCEQYEYSDEEECGTETDTDSQFNDDIEDINETNEPYLSYEFVMFNPPFEQKTDSELTELTKLQNIQKTQARIIRQNEKENRELICQTIQLKADNDDLRNKLNKTENMSNVRVKALQDERKRSREFKSTINKQNNEIKSLKTQLNSFDTGSKSHNNNINNDIIINYSFGDDCLDNKTSTQKCNKSSSSLGEIYQIIGRSCGPNINYDVDENKGTIAVSYRIYDGFGSKRTINSKISSIDYMMKNVFAQKLFNILKSIYTHRHMVKLVNQSSIGDPIECPLDYHMMVKYNNYLNKCISYEDVYVWSYVYRLINDFTSIINDGTGYINRSKAIEYFTYDRVIPGDRDLITKYQVAAKNSRLVEDNYVHLYHLVLANI